MAVFATDSAIAFAGSLGLFRLGFERAPNILASFDFTIIIAVNAVLFSLPALIMGGATIGARIFGFRLCQKGQSPSGWISLVRGLYFFPFGMMITGFHLPLKLMMGNHAPFDPMFGLRLTPEHPKAGVSGPDDLFDGLVEDAGTHNDILFGTQTDSIENAKAALERALGIRLEERESAFWGSYYMCKAYGGKMMLLPSSQSLATDKDTEKGAKKDTGSEVLPPLFQGAEKYQAIFHAACNGSRLRLVEDLVSATSFRRIGT